MDALQHYRRDTKLFVYCVKRGQKYYDWWYGVGGNAKWNPSYPSIPCLNIWGSDAWHSLKYFMILSWSLAVLSTSFSNLEWYWYLSCHFIHGSTFIYFHHYGLRTEPEGNFMDYLKRMLFFWKNAHSKK